MKDNCWNLMATKKLKLEHLFKEQLLYCCIGCTVAQNLHTITKKWKGKAWARRGSIKGDKHHLILLRCPECEAVRPQSLHDLPENLFTRTFRMIGPRFHAVGPCLSVLLSSLLCSSWWSVHTQEGGSYHRRGLSQNFGLGKKWCHTSQPQEYFFGSNSFCGLTS